MIKAKGRRSGRGCRREKRCRQKFQKKIYKSLIPKFFDGKQQTAKNLLSSLFVLDQTQIKNILMLILKIIERWPRRKNGQSLKTSGKLKISK